MVTENTVPDPHAGLSPLKIALFRNIWLASVVSNLGTWMHDVSAGWLMTDLAPDPFMVSLVQVSVVLPAFLFTIPAGALADIVDRRLYILTAVVWMACMATSIGVLTVTGHTTPWTLIIFTFGLGVGSAMMMPAFVSMIPDLVPRQQLTAAVTLQGIGMNLTRAVGPAIAGGLIALTGPGPVFLLNAVSFAGIFFVMYRYRSTQPRSTLPSERFLGALQKVHSFETRDGLLFFYDEASKPILRFSRLDPN
jgi:MFS family permease